MNQHALVTMSRAAALAIVTALPGIVVAAPSVNAACQVRPATPLDERVEQESLKGAQSFRRFIHRTQNIYQLDMRTEVAKIDARRDAEQECMARLKKATTTVAVEDPASSSSVAASR